MRVPEQLACSPTDGCLAELFGRRAKMRPDFPITLQIRACCICTTKCLECRDSQLGGAARAWQQLRLRYPGLEEHLSTGRLPWRAGD
jgi:hypothetical protein